MIRASAIGLALLAVGAFLFTGSAELRPGQKMPPMTLTDLNGKKVQLGGKTGKIQVVDFWAVW